MGTFFMDKWEDEIGKILEIISLTSHFEFEIARDTIIIK